MMFDGDGMEGDTGAEETPMQPTMPAEGGDMGAEESTGDESTGGAM